MNLLGLLGYPLGHSFSPRMINRIAREKNWSCCYKPFSVQSSQLDEFIRSVKLLPITGFNVTIPHKQAILNYCDEWSPAVKVIGAANVILNKDGKLVAANTDVDGFLAGLKKMIPSDRKVKRALILGAGGACRAVVYSLSTIGCEQVFIANRRSRENQWRNTAAALLQLLDVSFIQLGETVMADVAADVDLIVQATPVGTYPNVDQIIPFPFAKLQSNQFVYDLVYNPVETLFLKNSRKAGAQTQNGLAMFVAQAKRALSIWGYSVSEDELMQAIQIVKNSESD